MEEESERKGRRGGREREGERGREREGRKEIERKAVQFDETTKVL